MPARKEDEIMAEYLLKGGKMLEKTCKTCGCPLFEYKKKTFCVVCAENERPAGQAAGLEITADAPVSAPAREAPGGGASDIEPVINELCGTVLALCQRIRNDDDPDRCLVLMDAVKSGAEAIQILRQL